MVITVQVGTPEEDARRRDFTVNSLFYNINLQKVEDLTGKGLDDLRKGIIRTPLDPQITFMDGVRLPVVVAVQIEKFGIFRTIFWV